MAVLRNKNSFFRIIIETRTPNKREFGGKFKDIFSYFSINISCDPSLELSR